MHALCYKQACLFPQLQLLPVKAHEFSHCAPGHLEGTTPQASFFTNPEAAALRCDGCMSRQCAVLNHVLPL